MEAINKKLDKLPQKNVLILTVGFVVLFAPFYTIQQHWVTYFNSQGNYNLGFIGLLCIYFGFMVSNRYAEIWVQKLGYRQTLVLASLLYPIGLSASIYGSIAINLTGATIIGIAAGPLWLCQGTYINRTGTNESGKNAGFFYTLNYLGAGIGVFLGWKFIEYFGYQYTFAGLIIISCLTPIILAQLDDLQYQENRRPGNPLMIFKSRTSIQLSMLAFSSYFVFGIAYGQIPLEISKLLGDSYQWVSSLFYLIPVAFSFLSGNSSDKQGNSGIDGRRKIVKMSLLSLLFGFALLWSQFNWMTFIAGFISTTIGFTMLRTVVTVIPKDISSDEKGIDSNISFFWIIQNIAIISSIFIAKETEGHIVFAFAFGLIVVTFISSRPFFKYNLPDLKSKVALELAS